MIWVDGGYVNVVDAGLIGWAGSHEGIEIVVVPRNAEVRGFQVLPRRWVVERVRHEAPPNREEVRGLLRRAVAAAC